MTNTNSMNWPLIIGIILLLLSMILISSSIGKTDFNKSGLWITRGLVILTSIGIMYFTIVNSNTTEKRIENLEEKVKPENQEKNELINFLAAIQNDPKVAEFYFPKILNYKLNNNEVQLVIKACNNLSMVDGNKSLDFMIELLAKNCKLLISNESYKNLMKEYFVNLTIAAPRQPNYTNLIKKAFTYAKNDDSIMIISEAVELLDAANSIGEPLYNYANFNKEELIYLSTRINNEIVDLKSDEANPKLEKLYKLLDYIKLWQNN